MEAKETKRKITDFIEQEEDDLETHFVENPFIKIREKAARKQLDGKNQMGADDLEDDADTTANQDIYYNKEENKLVVQDFEENALQEAKDKLLKRQRRDTFGYGKNEDISDDDDDMDKNAGTKRNFKEQMGVHYKKTDLGKMQGQSATKVIGQLETDKNAKRASGSKTAVKKRDMKAQSKASGGHRVVQSGASYRSE